MKVKGSNVLLKNKKAKRKQNKIITDESERGFNFSRNRHKHTFYPFFSTGKYVKEMIVLILL